MRRVLFASLFMLGCVHANLVLVDRQTALEQQAAGSFPGLERDLDQADIKPGPVPLTGAQIEASGRHVESADAANQDTTSNGARVDALLLSRCIGEGLDGTLVETRDSCVGTYDAQEVARVIERANRDRRQVWQYLQGREPKATAAEVQKAWRETRLREVECGAQVQQPDGAWEPKKC